MNYFIKPTKYYKQINPHKTDYLYFV